MEGPLATGPPVDECSLKDLGGHPNVQGFSGNGGEDTL